MSRSKDLFNNTIIFGISNFTSKFLGFLMIPFYTRVLSTQEFGSADLIITSVGLILPIFTLSISEATLRFTLEKNNEIKDVFTVGFRVILFGFFILLIILPFLSSITFLSNYILLFYFLFISTVIQTFLNLFVRSLNNIMLVGIAGIVNSVSLVLFTIYFLYFLRIGVTGYILSFIIANFFASILLFLKAKVYKYFSYTKTNKSLLKEMLSYSSPLIPNSLSWWINHTSSRYFINYFSGISQVGLFAAATRMPSILVAIQGVFVQAWQLSAISEYDKKGGNEFFGKVYLAYSCLMVIGSSILILLSKYISNLIFSDSFFEAWYFTPFLFTSTLFGAMVGFYSSLYLAAKKTKILLLSTIVGAFVTILLNFILLQVIGTIGAAIASMVAYFTVWFFLHLHSQKFIHLEIDFINIYFQYFILVVQTILFIIIDSEYRYVVSICFLIILVLLNIKSFSLIHNFILSAFKNYFKS